MKLLTDQLIYSIDFAERMREYWNSSNASDNKKFFELFNAGFYYPFGADAFCDENLYNYIKNKNDIATAVIPKDGQIKGQQQFQWSKLNKTPVGTDPASGLHEDSTKIYLLECLDNYYGLEETEEV